MMDLDEDNEFEEEYDSEDLDKEELIGAPLINETALANLKTSHIAPKGMYFDEEYFNDLVLNHYLPTIKKDAENNIISRDENLEKEVIANILLIVNAVINKYGIWRFEKYEILQSEGVAECWRALPTFDPSRKKKWFHFLSLVTKYHLINLTRHDKEMREMADVSIQPDLESRKYIEDEFFFEDLEIVLFDIIDEHFLEKEKHEKYIDLASILLQYIRENKMIIGKNDLLSTFREYGYKTSDYKKFITDLEPYKQQLFELVS